MGIYSSVLASIDALGELDPRDEAVARLAMDLAQAMEDGTADRVVGIDTMAPKLLACLKELGLTPMARRVAMSSPATPAPLDSIDPLAELRERKRQRDLGA